MKKLFTCLLAMLAAPVVSFGNDLCKSFDPHQIDSVAKYPLLSFENTSFPKIRSTGFSFEFSDLSGDQQLICYGWPPDVLEDGAKQDCSKWCVLPQAFKSAAMSQSDFQNASKICAKCESNNSDPECSKVNLLKSSQDQFKINLEGKSSVIMLGKDGNPIIYQGNNGVRDIQKPSLALKRQSEYFIKKKREMALRSMPEIGYINSSSVKLIGAGASHELESRSVPQVTGTLGYKSCAEVSLETSKCPEKEDAALTASAQYNCKLAQTTAPAKSGPGIK